MNKSRTAFVSTAIPYVNAKPHIGFALELIQADVIANYHRQKGYDVFFLTGTDENSLKNVKAAKELGISTEQLCETNSNEYQKLLKVLNISNDDFIRTSRDTRHRLGAQKLWRESEAEDIYRKHYQGFYCVGCEDFYTIEEVPDNICPEHKTKLQVVEEENYFFKLSQYQKKIFDLINDCKLNIIPKKRSNEMISFINRGLKDFSISRSRQRAAGWGIEVPGDPAQVMYVWYDALANYISALNYNKDGPKYLNFWLNADKIIHVIGKGINRFHSIYWPAMLMSVGLRVPNSIFVHGYITINSEKISKSLGNVIDPFVIIKKYGANPLRYYLLKAFSPFEDGDFQEEKIIEAYNSDLANNIGNLIKRFETIGERSSFKLKEISFAPFPSEYVILMDNYQFNDALKFVMSWSSELNKEFEIVKPWVLLKDNNIEAVQSFLESIIVRIWLIYKMLNPFFPDIVKEFEKRYVINETMRVSNSLFERIK